MPIAILVNGAPSDHVSVLDRGFLLGDSVFETMRTYGRRCHALSAHLARLLSSCEKVGITAPDLGIAEREIARVIEESGEPECYVRLVVSRGPGLGLDPRIATDPTRVVLAGPLPRFPEALYREGVAVATVRAQRATDGSAALGAKVGSYIGHVLAFASVRDRADDALMVNEGGEISEGVASNLFIVERGELRTPPRSMGILAGITRSEVLAIADEHGWRGREKILFAHDVERADEAFLTSSLREIVPVRSIDGQRIGSGQAGPITSELLAIYRSRAMRLDQRSRIP